MAPWKQRNGSFKETCYCHILEGSVEEPSGELNVATFFVVVVVFLFKRIQFSSVLVL